MSRFFFAPAIALFVALCAPMAHADVITDWNQTAIEVLTAAKIAGAPAARAMAIVHVAMSEAVNSVQPRYTRYASAAPSAPKASAEAAAVSAARQALLQLAPAQKPKIDEAYAGSLSRI